VSRSRRDFLRYAAFGALPLLGQGTAQDTTKKPMGAGVPPDALSEPWLSGRQVDSTGKWDNDAGIIAIERRLRCRCGCMLDVYTCRTTDFTCTYSPAMHKEVVAMTEAKRTPEQIVAEFVKADGEKILMSPVAEGFNIAGYIVPGLAVTIVGLVLAAYLSRRRAVTIAAGGPELPGVPLPGTPDQAQRDRLKRALDEVDS
jgi:cytochrome c-type biogenesis protein CcmH/NrfF